MSPRSALDPRAVPARHARAWATEAFSVVTARWWWQVPLALALAGLCAWLPRLPQLVLGMTAVALHALLALAAVEHRSVSQVLAHHLGALLRLGAGWAIGLLTVVASLLAMTPRPFDPGPDGSRLGTAPATADLLDFAAGSDLLVATALAVVGPGALFFIALLLFVRAPLLQAIDLTALAVWRNPFVLPLGLAIALGLVSAGHWSGLFVVLGLPWTGALLTLAWRDVFLGRPPQPTRVRSQPARTARPSAVHGPSSQTRVRVENDRV